MGEGGPNPRRGVQIRGGSKSAVTPANVHTAVLRDQASGSLYKKIDLMKLIFFQYELSAFLTPFTKINVQIKGSAELRIVKDAILLNYGYTLFK